MDRDLLISARDEINKTLQNYAREYPDVKPTKVESDAILKIAELARSLHNTVELRRLDEITKLLSRDTL